MMGDEMAVRSGGMYGDPESKYTKATPVSSDSGGVNYGAAFRAAASIASGAAGIGSALMQGEQIHANLEALKAERDYNIENYQQKMADTLASNKMSFYSSGLDFSKGSAADVIANNQSTMQKDLNMMMYNYRQTEKQLKQAKKASRLNVAGSVFQMGASAAALMI